MPRFTRVPCALGVLLLCMARPTHAQAHAGVTLLTCTFPIVASSDPDSLASPPTVKRQSFGFAITDIDAAKGTATIVGNAGTGQMLFVAADFAWSFVEIMPAGFINTTTVYGPPTRSGTYPAVTSRHTRLVSQNYGSCTAN